MAAEAKEVEAERLAKQQLQASEGKEFVFAKLKPADGEALLLLIRKTAGQEKDTKIKEQGVMIDLGGGDGYMLEYVIPLFNQATVYNVEPAEELADAFKRRVATQYAQQLTLGGLIRKKMQELSPADLPQADLVLASHSLYFCKRQWYKPEVDINQHLFSLFLNWLNENGLFCAILQSGEPTKILGKKGELLPSLYQFEHFVYSQIIATIKADAMDKDAIERREVNAEMLLEALEDFSTKLSATQQRQIEYRVTEPIVCCINLGEINFTPDAQGKYPQNERTRQLFMFYTRNTYDQLTPATQKKFLEYIQQHCQTPEGTFEVVHQNKAFVMSEVTPRPGR